MASEQLRPGGLRRLDICCLTMTSSSNTPGRAAETLSGALKEVGGGWSGGLHEPLFGGNEKAYLAECIDSGVVSSVGAFVTRFEDELADYVGAPHAIAIVNGTSALHVALVALGVRRGEEVIVPALTFVATASAVSLAGGIPHFVDVSKDTWGVDADYLRDYLKTILRSEGGIYVNKNTGRPVSAVVPMHALGHPFDSVGLRAVAEEFGLAFLEDAAEALGSFSGKFHTGLAGHAAVFSFNGNKTITTGGGGAIVTKNPELASKVRHLSTTAKVPHPFEFNHDAVAYNYRMPNINAALGVAQLEQLPQLVERQRALHGKYQKALEGLQLGTLKSETPGTRSNYWLQALVLREELTSQRDEIMTVCLDNGVPVRPLWKPLNTLSPYVECPSTDTPVTRDLYARVICLPSSAALSGSLAH